MKETPEKTSSPNNKSVINTIEDYYKKDLLNELGKEETERIIKNRTVTVDIKINKENDEFQLLLSGKKGFPGIDIKKIDVLIYFCKLHGFLPKLNRIYINGIDVLEKFQELDTFLKFGIMNGEFNFGLFGEINKITKTINENIQNSQQEENSQQEKNTNYSEPELNFIITQFEKLFIHTPREVINIFGNKLERMNIEGALLENIFAEVALRMEDKIRDYLGIYSTYLINSTIEDDKHKKTDLNWIIKTSPEAEYKNLPIQFTISNAEKLQNDEELKRPKNPSKLKNIEGFLFEKKKKKKLKEPFVVLFLNGYFKEEAEYGDLVKKYQNWLNNTHYIRSRKKKHKKEEKEKFPFFIDTINQKYLNGSEITYFLLHVIFKNIDFAQTKNENFYEEILENIETELENLQDQEIKLSKDKCYLKKVEIDLNIQILDRNKEKQSSEKRKLTKLIFNVYHKEQQLGTIVIYK